MQIDNNNIKNIEDGSLDGDVKLDSICATDNELEGLPKNLFKDMKSLTFVDFGNNYFSELPECFNDANALKSLQITNNEMTDITKVDFSNMLDLEKVNFYKNYIKEVPDGTWKTVKEMTESDQAEALNGVKQYRMTVYSNELNLAQEDTNKPAEPTTEKKDQVTTTAKNKVTQTLKVALSRVTNLKVKNKKKRKAVITWKKVKNADGYQVYRATKKSGKFKKVKTIKEKKVYSAFSVKKGVVIKK